MIPAVTPDPAPFSIELDAAQAALDHAIIIETSALVIATSLPGRWPQLRGAFTELRMTRDAWNDIHAAREVLRDPETAFSVSYEPGGQARIEQQLTSDAHEYLSRRFDQISYAMDDLTLISAPDLGLFARYTFGSTDPALSPLAACATTDISLWSDDAAIRRLADQHGVPAFGTLALLHVLTEAGRIADTLREDALTLARGYVADLVLTEDELTSLAAENHYLPGPATLVIGRPLFWAAPGAAQAQFTDLTSNVNRHAPESLTAWLQAACTGLIARCPQAPAEGHVVALAEAVATKIRASESIRTSLIDVALQAANDATEATQ